MVDLSRLMQDAAILEVIDKSADEASNLSAQNSYQAMRIEELEQQLAERDAELAALKGHAEKVAVWLETIIQPAPLTFDAKWLAAYRAAYPKEADK